MPHTPSGFQTALHGGKPRGGEVVIDERPVIHLSRALHMVPRRLLFAAAIAVMGAASTLFAQEQKAPPEHEGVKITPDVVYGHKDGLALTFDLYEPAKKNGAGVLFMVSGGWFSRWAPPESMRPLFVPLLDKGFTVFA